MVSVLVSGHHAQAERWPPDLCSISSAGVAIVVVSVDVAELRTELEACPCLLLFTYCVGILQTGCKPVEQLVWQESCLMKRTVAIS